MNYCSVKRNIAAVYARVRLESRVGVGILHSTAVVAAAAADVATVRASFCVVGVQRASIAFWPTGAGGSVEQADFVAVNAATLFAADDAITKYECSAIDRVLVQLNRFEYTGKCSYVISSHTVINRTNSAVSST